MKRLAGLTALALIITGTGGCSWLGFRDRGSDYLQAQQTAPMRLPEGVQAKHLDPLLPIPTQIPSLAARDDEFETPRPQALVAGPDSGEFSLQKSGDARWLLALRPPAEVWPLARQYFERNGLAIAEERPQTGEFITAWQRYDRLSPELSRRLGGRVTVAAPDAQVRVRVRIERDVCTLSVDTSGEPLHKRGYKAAVARAPMRETMAALLLSRCGFTGTEPVLDPMCGSGTFVIEAAEVALRLNPGRARGFAFERLATFDAADPSHLRMRQPPEARPFTNSAASWSVSSFLVPNTVGRTSGVAVA